MIDLGLISYTVTRQDASKGEGFVCVASLPTAAPEGAVSAPLTGSAVGPTKEAARYAAQLMLLQKLAPAAPVKTAPLAKTKEIM